MEQNKSKLTKYFLPPILAACILVIVASAQFTPSYKLEVHFLNVGQGDAILIETYEGNQVLIDGGPSSQVLQELGKVMPFYDRIIEAIILSHPHADHVAGLVEILKRYEIKKVFLADVEFDSAFYEEFLWLIEQKRIEKIFVSQGMRLHLDSSTIFDVYYPMPGTFVGDNNASGILGSKRNPNDLSIVGKLSFGQTTFLFTGDAGTEIEQELLSKFNLDADILKVGHHGSRHSTSKEFLNEVTPNYSVISVGKNNYGHPTQEVLDRLTTIKSQILRTDLNQTITIESDGINLDVFWKD